MRNSWGWEWLIELGTLLLAVVVILWGNDVLRTSQHEETREDIHRWIEEACRPAAAGDAADVGVWMADEDNASAP